jgi:GNAT superfamily N-acetyltransferase
MVNYNILSIVSANVTDQSANLVPVESDVDRSTLRELLTEFHEWMADHAREFYGVNTEIYDSDEELAEDFDSLTEETESWAWVARTEGEPAGCVLLYGESDELAEFRRLYVRPAHRGAGIGRRLVRETIDRARTESYETLALTTPPWSETARALYASMGFERVPPYPETRLPERYHDEAIFMRFDLSAEA